MMYEYTNELMNESMNDKHKHETYNENKHKQCILILSGDINNTDVPILLYMFLTEYVSYPG